jgi:hypothetical protein
MASNHVFVEDTSREELNLALAIALGSIAYIVPEVDQISGSNYCVIFSADQAGWVEPFTVVLERLGIGYTFDEPPAMSA